MPRVHGQQRAAQQVTSAACLAFAAILVWSQSAPTFTSSALRPRSRGFSPRRAPRVLRRGWGDPVDFFDAVVQENVEAADGFRFITIEAPPSVTEVYTKPGQFVQAKAGPDDKPSFFAISSPPSDGGKPEFLIKVAPSNEWLLNTQKGDNVLLSAAMGKGFPVDGESWKDTVNQVGIFATGSGIAPIRSVIEGGALRGKAVRLYYGARSEAAMPFQERFADWTKKDSVEIIPVLSQPATGWGGRTGYVQQVFKQDEEQGEGFVLSAQHGALLCGQKEMAEEVREVYESLNVPPERVLTNF
mmetsp:Transcript_10007/g.22426  ORF Transcript_10007/g.22426 Transcript_10007/m.22426 type:complete len:300 (-) Transcript_10007:63-962(-)